MSAPTALLVSVTDFGWGSIGKLRLILDEITGVDLVLDPESSTADLAGRVIGARHTYLDHGRARPAAALVVNDPVAADRIAATGVPVVYVDSLPYLWTTADEVPRWASVHCAQKFPGALPEASPLRGRDIRWVEPITPPPRKRRGGGGVVVNVGGMHSHLVGGAVDAYQSAVLLPLAEVLAAGPRPVAAVCGNIPRWAREELAAVLPGVPVGPLTAYEFHSVLQRADLLLTSPGSTTILQAASLRLPCVLLPPQNLSQILNAELYGVPGPGVLPWPASVIDRDVVEQLRPAGEDATLEYVYRRIVERASGESVRADLVGRLEAAVVGDVPPDGLSPELVGLGAGGARQVARVVRQALLAPLSAQARP
jgi:hydroxymethylcytosylglucuronate/cytosylglucuronate synthase